MMGTRGLGLGGKSPAFGTSPCRVCFAIEPPAVTMKMEFTPAESRNRDARRAAHLVDFFILASRLEVGRSATVGLGIIHRRDSGTLTTWALQNESSIGREDEGIPKVMARIPLWFRSPC